MRRPKSVLYIRDVSENITARNFSARTNVPNLDQHQAISLKPGLLEVVSGTGSCLHLNWNYLFEVKFAVSQEINASIVRRNRHVRAPPHQLCSDEGLSSLAYQS